jgi:hypothetical protein
MFRKPYQTFPRNAAIAALCLAWLAACSDDSSPPPTGDGPVASDAALEGGQTADQAVADSQPAADAAAPDQAPAPDLTCPDADNDTVCDAADQCAGEDDLLDLDANSTPDCVENLLANGQLATDVSGWTLQNLTLASWIANDGQGSAHSGAIKVTNTSTAGVANVTGVYQCVPATAGTTYTMLAQLMVPGGQAVAGNGGFNIAFHDNATCLGTGLSVANSPLWQPTSWTQHSFTATAPAGTQAMRVRINAQKPASATPFVVYYDNVLIH